MVTDPNVVPMIDVLLVLLVIFMLSAVTLVRRAFDLQLPERAAGAPGDPPLVLSIAPGPQYSLNGQPLSPGDLEGQLRGILAPRTERILYVRGARTLSYQEVVRAFDAIRGAGGKVTAVVPGDSPAADPPRQ